MNHEQPTAQPSPDRVLKWAVFFVLAYVVQGFAQTTGVLFQPLQNYFREAHGYSAGQLAGVVFWVTFPWYIKPVYGLLADFIPFFGFRRFSYLIVSCVVSFAAFTLVCGVRDPTLLVWALIATAVCTAVGDVMVDALMVEKGQATGRVKLFQGLQWTAISAIGVLAAVAGGRIAGYADKIGDPFRGVQIAAIIAMVGPALLLGATLWAVRERRSRLDLDGVRRTSGGLLLALKSKPLLGVILFVSLFWFQPGLITPMYIFCTETLDISEQAYGDAAAWAYGGYVVGALLFTTLLGPRLSFRQLAVLSILIYAGSTFAYLGLRGETSLVLLSLLYGATYMISNLTLLSLAAQVCPRHVEAFVFAFLMGLFNFVKQGSEWIGGQLFDELIALREPGASNPWLSWLDLSRFGLDQPIHGLIVVSGAVTLLAFVFVPLLPRRQDEEPVVETASCPFCFYDLRGNPEAALCPECGGRLGDV